MKKWKGVLAILAMSSCLVGCSQFKAEHNAVKLGKDGSLQTAVIDTLDKAYYSRDELEQTINDAVSEYNAANASEDDEAIVVKKYSGEDDAIELYMNYATAEDYQKFNNVTLYAGDLQGAYDGKYEFPDEFQKVEKGEVTGTVTKSEILSGLNYSVLIYSEEMDVEVPGKILYISPDAVVTGKKKATNIAELIGQQESETEAASEAETDSDDGAEIGKFEVESDASQEETESQSDEEEKATHTLTFVIYE